MQKEKEFVPLSKAGPRRKISFFSAIFIAIGACIGAGIFFKAQAVLHNSNSSLVLAIITWIVAAFAVIAMALALLEIVSARNDSLSLVGWCQTFNSEFIYKNAKNFMFFIYLPITFFCMPLYIINSLQDSVYHFRGAHEGISATFGTKADWLIWAIIAMAISSYFIVMSGLSAKAGNIQNKILLSFKFVPLLFASFIGFVLLAMGAQSSAKIAPIIEGSVRLGTPIASLTPGMGMFLGVGAIFFAYDGFYVAAGVESEMEEPKRVSIAILLGLLIVTVTYLIIAVSMSIVGDGSINGLAKVMIKQLGWNSTAVYSTIGTMNLFIAIGSLGVLNGFALWASRYAEELLRRGDLPFARKFYSKLSPRRPLVGTMYTLVAYLSIALLFTFIGALGYHNAKGFKDFKYGFNMGRLCSFADLMASWGSVFSFTFIVLPIYGGIRNRKSNRIAVKKGKYFLPLAWIAVAAAGLALCFQVITPILDLALIPAIDKSAIAAKVAQDNLAAHAKDGVAILSRALIDSEVLRVYNETIVSRIMLIIVLFIVILGSYLPIPIENALMRRKYGSLENFLIEKRAFFKLN